ncbi:MAG: hypothetical protein V4628_10220 [Pseudomonadota bacterium]
MRYPVSLSHIISCILLFAATISYAAENPYADLAGSFEGEVYNGADLDPVVTKFTLEPSGRLTGEYTVSEENGAYSGRLSNIVFEDTHTITLEWTDQFGEGFAVMEFSSDFTSFAGEWSGKDGANPLPWNGKK